MKYLVFLLLIICSSIHAQSEVKFTCAATSKTTGNPCRIKVEHAGDTCRIHSANTPRCGAPTKSGSPCRRTVKTAGTRCSQHNVISNGTSNSPTKTGQK